MDATRRRVAARLPTETLVLAGRRRRRRASSQARGVETARRAARMRSGAIAVPREEPLISTARTALVTATELPALSSRLSVEGKRTELVRGDLIVMTPAGGRHGQVAHRVGLVIGNHVLDRNLGRVFAAETGFLLQRDPDTVRAPDAAFVAGERLGTGEVAAGFLEMAPDLAVEVDLPWRFRHRRSSQGRRLAGSRDPARLGRRSGDPDGDRASPRRGRRRSPGSGHARRRTGVFRLQRARA